MFCQYNAAMQQVDSHDISTDQSCTRLDTAEPQPQPASTSDSTADVVILSDGDGPARITANQECWNDPLSETTNNLHSNPRNCPFPPSGMDSPRSNPRKNPSMPDRTYCGKASNDKSSGSKSIRTEIQGEDRFSSVGTRDHRLDSDLCAYSTCFNDRGISSHFDSLQDSSVCPEDPDNGGSFSGQNPVTGIDLPFKQSDRNMFTNSERLDFVREQKQPETNIREHVSDHHLGLGIEFELSPDRFRFNEDKDDDRPLLNFDKDWIKKPHHTPLPRKLWPDEEPPKPPKRFRTSLPAADLPIAEKPSSSGPSGLPVETTFCAVDFSMPGSNVFRSKAVSLMKSEEGLHVITEETVAHTVYDDLPESGMANPTNKTQNRLRCYQDAKDRRDGPKPASFAEKWNTTSAPDGPSNKRSYDRIQEIILSPNPDSETVVRREPSKVSCLVGGKDRTDIAGGWKPLSGQTVVRKPPKPSQNSMTAPLAGTGKPPKSSVDSLFTSIDGGTWKSGMCTRSVSGRDGLGIAKKDREPIMAQSASLSTTRSGVDKKSGNSTNDFLELFSLDSAASVNGHSLPNIHKSCLGMARTSSSGERLESVMVQNTAEKSNRMYQCTASKPTESVSNFAEPPSRNGNKPLWEFELGGSERSRPSRASSSGNRIESAKVQNPEKTMNLAEGHGSGVELPSRNGSRSLNRLGDLGFSDSRHGLPRKSSFGERVESDSVQITETKKSSSHCKDGHKDVASKWHKFEETTATDLPRQPPVQTTSSNLVERTAKQHPFQTATQSPVGTYQPDSLTLVQIISCSPIQAQTSGSDLVRTTTPNSNLVRPTVPSKKPEVACVTPQVRQPLRALHLDQDTSGISRAEDGMYHESIGYEGLILFLDQELISFFNV